MSAKGRFHCQEAIDPQLRPRARSDKFPERLGAWRVDLRSKEAFGCRCRIGRYLRIVEATAERSRKVRDERVHATTSVVRGRPLFLSPLQRHFGHSLRQYHFPVAQDGPAREMHCVQLVTNDWLADRPATK